MHLSIVGIGVSIPPQKHPLFLAKSPPPPAHIESTNCAGRPLLGDPLPI